MVAVKQQHPDLLLATKGMNIRVDTLDALRRTGIRTAVWFPDNAAREPYASWVRTVGSRWDHFFSFDSAIYDQMPTASHERVHVLPFGIDPAAYQLETLTPKDHARFDCDICLIGAAYPDRIRLLEQVKDLNVKVWGWSGWRATSLRAQYHGPLDARESARAYRCAKICLNTNILPHAHGLNLKTFEIAAAGGFQLTDRLPDLDASFVIGKELDVFTDERDFRRKVQYWLAHNDLRQAIAAAGRERALKDHALRQRMHGMLTTIFP